MTAGRFVGLDRPLSARFAMLLSIPTILGAGLLAAVDMMRSGNSQLTSDALVGGYWLFSRWAPLPLMGRPGARPIRRCYLPVVPGACSVCLRRLLSRRGSFGGRLDGGAWRVAGPRRPCRVRVVRGRAPIRARARRAAPSAPGRRTGPPAHGLDADQAENVTEQLDRSADQLGPQGLVDDEQLDRSPDQQRHALEDRNGRHEIDRDQRERERRRRESSRQRR